MPTPPARHRPHCRRSTIAGRAAIALLAATLLFTATACEGPAAVAYVFTGPSRKPAVFNLDKSKTTLFVVRDPDRQFSDPNAPRLIAAVAADTLERDGGMDGKFIDQRDLVAERINLGETNWKRIPMGQLGRRLGAQQVIEARVIAMGVGSANDGFRPLTELEVSVWNLDNEVIFPAEADERGQFIGTNPNQRTYSLKVRQWTRVPPINGSSNMLAIEQSLAQETGVELAKLFHAWYPPDSGDSFK
ncbi:MAG: hypothetical protein AAF750_15660 [Planctomycetota bacterium]